ncbi:MAG: biotin synthase, partial [Mesorhizobium sp.]
MNVEPEVRPAMEPTGGEIPRWNREAAEAIHDLPFNDLLFRAQAVHRAYFDQNRVQLSRLLSIKTGGCPEDCGYCSQSA